MSKPKKFILNSDFATIKNDSVTSTITINIPADNIPGNGTIQIYSGSATLGKSGSPIEYDVNYSSTSRRWKTARVEFVENEGLPNQYQGAIFIYKSGASTVTARVAVFNGSPNTITKYARTVTVRVRTFLSPFN